MKTFAVIVALLLVAGVVVYLLLEKRPGYGAWYGLARLTGAPLDIGPVTWATLKRHRTPNDALVCPAGALPERRGRPGAEDLPAAARRVARAAAAHRACRSATRASSPARRAAPRASCSTRG